MATGWPLSRPPFELKNDKQQETQKKKAKSKRARLLYKHTHGLTNFFRGQKNVAG